jgi:hypothetical protein
VSRIARQPITPASHLEVLLMRDTCKLCKYAKPSLLPGRERLLKKLFVHRRRYVFKQLAWIGVTGVTGTIKSFGFF